MEKIMTTGDYVLDRLYNFFISYNIKNIQQDCNSYTVSITQYEIGHIEVINNIEVLKQNNTRYGVKITKTISVFHHTFFVYKSNILDIEQNKEIETEELIRAVKEKLNMPFLVFMCKYCKQDNELEQFIIRFLSVIISEYLPLPKIKMPDLTKYNKNIKFNIDVKSLIDTNGLENYFDGGYNNSYSSILGIDYKNDSYIKYIESIDKNIDEFCDISLSKYKETKDKQFEDNYTIAMFLLGNTVESDLYTLLDYMSIYNEKGVFPEDNDFYILKSFNGKAGDLFQLLQQSYLIQLLDDIQANIEHILSLLNVTNIDEAIKFKIYLIKYGAGIPNDETYIPKSLYKKYPLKREIYNYLTVLQNIYTHEENCLYKQAYETLISLTMDTNYKVNKSVLNNQELFNLGLYFYVFSELDKAQDIFKFLIEQLYDIEDCNIMLNKINVLKRKENSLQKIGLSNINKRLYIKSKLDIYQAAFWQLCNNIDYKDIQASVIANWQLLTNN